MIWEHQLDPKDLEKQVITNIEFLKCPLDPNHKIMISNEVKICVQCKKPLIDIYNDIELSTNKMIVTRG